MLKLAAKTWISKLASALFNFGAVVLLSRYLGAADRGVCALYAVVIAISLVVNDLASGATVIYIMRFYDWRKMRIIYWVWATVSSGIVCLLFLLWGKIGVLEFCWLWLICWLGGTVTLQQQLMLGLKKFVAYNLLATSSAALIFLLLWVLFALGYLNTLSYLFALAAVWGAVLTIGFILLNNAETNPSNELGWIPLAKKMFSHGGLNQSVQVVGIMNNRLIYYLLPAATLGVFSNALALAEAMLLLPGSMGQVFYANLVSKSETSKAKTTIKRMMAINVVLLVAGWFLVFIIPGSVYTLVFGEGFIQVKKYLQILAGGIVGYGIYLLCSYWQSAAGKFYKNLFAVASGLIINIALLTILFFNNMLDVINITYSLSASFIVIGFVAAIQLWQQIRN